MPHAPHRQSVVPEFEPLEPRVLFSSTIQWQPLGEAGNGGRSDALTVSPFDSSHLLVAGDVLGSAMSFDGGKTWEPATGFDSLEHSDFTFHPTNADEVWAATLSGPYRSTDGGRTWTSQRQGMPAPDGFGYDAAVEKVLYDPSDTTHQTLLAFGGDHRELKEGAAIASQLPNYGKIWRSTDGGQNWSDGGMADLPGNITAVAYESDSSDVLLAAVSDDGIYRSTGDGPGATWVRRSNGLPTAGNGVRISGIVSDPAKPWIQTATVGTSQPGNINTPKVGGIYRSTDRGWNWTRVEAGEETGSWPPDFRHVEVSSDGGTLWAADVTFGTGKGVYKSTDSGATWQHVLTGANVDQLLAEPSPLNDGTAIGGWWVEIDPNDADTVYILGSSLVLKTTDGGQTWTDETNINFGNNTWRSNGYTGWVAENVAFNPYDPNMIVTQGLDSLLAGISRDGGYSWDVGFREGGDTGLPAFNAGRDVTFAPNGVMFIALGQGPNTDELIARSTDNGASWELLAAPATGQVATAVYTNPSAPNNLWAVVDGVLYKSSNALAGNPASVTWIVQNVDGTQVDDIAPIPGQTNHFYVSTDNGVYKTTNGGGAFTRVGGTGFAGPDDRVNIAVDPNNTNVVWAASIGNQANGLYKFDGSAWQTLTLPGGADRWARDVAVNPTDSNHIVVATGQDPFVDINGGTFLWFSEDGGSTWTQESTNLPVMRFRTVTFSPDGSRVIAGSGGRGFWVAELDRTTIGAQAEHLLAGEGASGDAFNIGMDAEASDGRYIVVPNSAGDSSDANADAPVAKFFFTLDEAQQGVTFRARVQTPGGTGDNSFFVRVNEGAWQPWVTAVNRFGWTWDTVSNVNTGQTLSVDLGAGRHVLEFKLRDAGTWLDEVDIVLAGADPATQPATSMRIQAERADGGSGVQVVDDTRVGFINAGDYIVFEGVDFSSGFTTLLTRAGSARQGGTIEIRLGSPTASIIASTSLGNTGGWTQWESQTTTLPPLTGVQDLYITFSGGTGFLLDLDYIELIA
ncbi:MAG: carbohydrate-binding protein [Planctomycetota bacterium]